MDRTLGEGQFVSTIGST